jgi:hypothetical protein
MKIGKYPQEVTLKAAEVTSQLKTATKENEVTQPEVDSLKRK